MNQLTFFENFDVLAEAPDGVQKLREMILLLAVQGKLMPQDSNDEPASVLLEKIIAEKDILIKEKKIKRSRALQTIDQQKIPYELPYNWGWICLGDVGHDCGQKKPDKKFTYIDVSAINKEQGIISDDVDILEPSEAPSRARKLVSKGSVIYATVRPYLLNIAIIDKQFEPEPIVSTAFAVLHPYSGIINKYLYYYLRSRPFINYVESEMMGMAYPAINDGKLYRGLVPVPPLEEQKRIVTKVDQLMALCDQLEARQQKKHEQRISLNNAALDKLLTAPTPEEFAQHWQRICDNFDLLYDAPETVGQLRQAILQLAVQGKLVAQDEGDEPAGVLLEKVKAEKERLIKGGKISKSKPLPEISVNEIYFELPYGWQWIRFDDICSYTQRGKGPKYVEISDIPVVSQKCIQWDGFKLDRARFISPSSLEKYNEERFLRTGDLLWNSTGTGTIGRVNIYIHEDNSYDKVVADSHVTVVRPILLNSHFIYCWIASPIIQNEIEEMASGTTNQIELNLSTIKNHLVPLPPLQEQHRIVTKVDQLMALCNELEAGLVKAQTDGGKLMEAVVHHALAG